MCGKVREGGIGREGEVVRESGPQAHDREPRFLQATREHPDDPRRALIVRRRNAQRLEGVDIVADYQSAFAGGKNRVALLHANLLAALGDLRIAASISAAVRSQSSNSAAS